MLCQGADGEIMVIPLGEKNRTQSPLKNRVWLLIPVLIVLMVLSRIFTGGGAEQGMSRGKGMKGPIPVTVVEAQRATVPIELKAIGSVEPVSMVKLKPQVDGAVVKIHFTQGQFVEAGQLLFTIDPRSLVENLRQTRAIVSRDMSQVQQAGSNLERDKAQIKVAEANLEKDLAQLRYAEAQEQRYATLLEKEYVSKEQYEQILANKIAAQATVQADRAAVDNAKALLGSSLAAIESTKATVSADTAVHESNRIKLHYGYVRAPAAGRTGDLLVHEGDVVNANMTDLVVINPMNPIHVTFSLPEQQLSQIRKYQSTGTLRVTASLPSHPEQSLTGSLTFLDNTVDPNTGTIHMKGVFDNAQHMLWPGQFVNVTLNLANEPGVVTVPSQAVQTGQKGEYVYIIQNGVAEYREVVLSRIAGKIAVIQKGIQPGEAVVVDGHLQLAPGLKVKTTHGAT
jgi:membrane fusion protein, multidrug efflux system